MTTHQINFVAALVFASCSVTASSAVDIPYRQLPNTPSDVPEKGLIGEHNNLRAMRHSSRRSYMVGRSKPRARSVIATAAIAPVYQVRMDLI
jgi:hypothetical protein